MDLTVTAENKRNASFADVKNTMSAKWLQYE